jgi:S1-C subfamily serine protease
VVGAVQPGSPAATAGLQAQDVITQIDGQDLTGESALAQTVSGHKPGDQITLTVLRGGQSQSVQVTLGTFPTQ